MKKKLFGIAFAVATITATVWSSNYTKKNSDLTDLALGNIEALATDRAVGKCTGPKADGECQSVNTNPCSDTSGCES